MGRTGGDLQTGVRAAFRRLGEFKARGANVVEVVLTSIAFGFLRAAGVVADTPLWIYLVLTVGGGVVSALAFRWWGRDCTTVQLHLRVALNIGLSSAVIYATGWGPMLAIGYMFITSDAIKHSGARAALPCLIYSPIAIAAGQLAIAVNAAPTLLEPPQVHGLAALVALGLEFAIHTLGATTAEKERAEVEVRRSERRFRSLVQNGSDVVALVSAQGEVLYITPSFARMGFALDGPFAQRLHPDDLPRAADAFARVLSAPDRTEHIEARLQHADSSWRWLEVTMRNQMADPSVQGVVVNFHDITEHKQFEERLAHVAYHDGLTGLSNRAGFVEKLERAVQRARDGGFTTALLFLDLDHFKIINDSYGHNVGDRVLVEVATRLRHCVRAEDTIGRYGGDEFTILIEQANRAMAAEFAGRITDVLRAPFVVNGRELPVTASVGLVVSDVADDVDDLLRSADLAMYLAKENGRARWELFDAAMGSGILERYRVAAELRESLERDDLVAYFQPEVSLATGAVVGFEALVRWNHPVRGLLPPAAFISVAEENALILGIDHCVLEQACAALLRLQDAAGADSAPLFMSVNISPDSLTEKGADALLRIVAASGIDAKCLQLEITERTAIAESPAARAAIERLRQQHIRVVIDDFGTGYSSLECLQRLPIDGIKIDRGFVADLDITPAATAIVHAVVTLGHQLGLHLTAEGVETPAQLERLDSLGCDSAQGFYFAQPLPLDAALDLVRDAGRLQRRSPAV